MRVGIGGIWQETNTYSSRATTLREFADFELLTGDAIAERHAGTRSVIGGMLDADDLDVVPIFSAGAWPGGPADRATLDQLHERFTAALRNAGPLDGLLLNLHGAMVCEGVDDVELETVRVVRDVVGDVPLTAVVDLHGNPSPEMVEACGVVISYDTYPHVDMYERGREAAELLGETLAGAHLRTQTGKVPQLSSPLAQATDERPMAQLQKVGRELTRDAGLRRICLLPGFPYSDVARAGFSVLVTASHRQAAGAREVISRLCARVERCREDFTVSRPSPAAAVRQALASSAGPVVLADVADNIGGGSPGDGTALLAELLAQGARDAVVLITDAEVAREAAARGAGRELDVEVGAKTDDRHGDPIPVHGRVLRITNGHYRSEGSWMTGRDFTMGTTAVIDLGGVTLIVMERATPPFHREQLTSVGIDPASASVIAVKGAIAWRAAYGDVAVDAIEVDTPGVCPVDPANLPRTTTPMSTW